MKFLYGKLYKKYFPIKSTLIFYEMEKREFDILTKWIKNIENDILYRNIESRSRAIKAGADFYRRIKIDYPKSINNLHLLLQNKQFSKLDKEDLEFVNDVLYRHKYNTFISYFIFPIRKSVHQNNFVIGRKGTGMVRLYIKPIIKIQN